MNPSATIGGGLSWLMGGSTVDCSAAPAPAPAPPALGFTPLGMTPLGGEAAAAVPAPEAAATDASMPPAAPAAAPVDPSKRPSPGHCDAPTDASAVLTIPVFEGYNFVSRKPLNPQFIATHTLNIGSGKQNSYQGGVVVVPKPEIFLSANMNHEANLDGRIGYQNADYSAVCNLHLNGTAQSIIQPTFDYMPKNKDYSISAKVAPGLYQFSYLQSVTKNLVLGGDGIYVGSHRKTVVTARGVFTTTDKKHQVSGLVTDGGVVKCSYSKKLSPAWTLATEIELDVPSRESKVTTGYRVNYRQSKLSANINNEYQIQALVEETIMPGIKLSFSAVMDHPKDNHKFGVGFQLGE